MRTAASEPAPRELFALFTVAGACDVRRRTPGHGQGAFEGACEVVEWLNGADDGEKASVINALGRPPARS